MFIRPFVLYFTYIAQIIIADALTEFCVLRRNVVAPSHDDSLQYSSNLPPLRSYDFLSGL